MEEVVVRRLTVVLAAILETQIEAELPSPTSQPRSLGLRLILMHTTAATTMVVSRTITNIAIKAIGDLEDPDEATILQLSSNSHFKHHQPLMRGLTKLATKSPKRYGVWDVRYSSLRWHLVGDYLSGVSNILAIVQKWSWSFQIQINLAMASENDNCF